MAETNSPAKPEGSAEKAVAGAAEQSELRTAKAEPASDTAGATKKAEAPKAEAPKAEVAKTEPAKAAPAAKAPRTLVAKAPKVAKARRARVSAKAPVAKGKPGPKPRSEAVKAAAKVARVARAAQSVQSRIKPAVVKAPARTKEIKMANQTNNTKANEFTARVEGAMKDAQARTRAALEKSQAALGGAGEFTKGNLEAVVESGRILATGLQDLGKEYVAETRSLFELMTADIKELASVRSPSQFFEIQGKIARKNFDAVVARTSKNSETMLKLANDAFQPISNRVSLAIEQAKKAA